ncbi:hypothetical protein [Paeniglutamicibacter sp. NPDC091659]|uniref:hypothetical protein n=1 Tax=Paeniglutamicibacter sp. NPDC091659 TaxID=3364389 RepID=UPI00380AE065
MNSIDSPTTVQFPENNVVFMETSQNHRGRPHLGTRATITLRVPQKLKADLKVIAAEQGCTITELLTRTIDQIVNAEKPHSS